jgi:hypothetical protein
VDHRLLDDLPAVGGAGAVLNPLRSEAEAFRFLIYVVICVAVVVGVVLVARALL